MSNQNKDSEMIISAIVTEALPNAMFRVRRIPDKKLAPLPEAYDKTMEAEQIAYLSGRMKLHRIKVFVGDTVQILVEPYGGKGRIIKRGN